MHSIRVTDVTPDSGFYTESEASVCSDGSAGEWQSDDEPPQDRPGNLVPVAFNSRGTDARAVKEIVEIGSTFLPAGPDDEVSLHILPAPPGIGLQWTYEAISRHITEMPISRRTISEMEVAGGDETLIALALPFMCKGELSVIRVHPGYTQRPRNKDPVTTKRHQQLRRKFTRANAEENPALMAKYRQFPPRVAVRLLTSVARTKYCSGAVKVEVKKAISWQIPSEASQIIMAVACVNDEWDISFVVKQWESIRTQEIDTSLKDLVHYTGCEDVFRSMRVGEVAIVTLPEQAIEDRRRKQSGATASSAAVLTPGRWLVRLVAIETRRQFAIHDERSTNPCLVEWTAQHDPTVVGKATLVAIHDEEFDRYLQATRKRGAEEPQHAELVTIELQHATSGFSNSFMFFLFRSSEVPLWFHELCSLIKVGQRYRLKLECVTSTAADTSLIEFKPRDSSTFTVPEWVTAPLNELPSPPCLAASTNSKPSCPGLISAQLVGTEDHIRDSSVVLSDGFGLWKVEVPRDVERCARESQIPSDLQIPWSFLDLDRWRRSEGSSQSCQITMVGACGRERPAWHGPLEMVVPHATALISEAAKLLRANDLCFARALATDAEEYCRHLGSRAMENDDDFELFGQKAAANEAQGLYLFRVAYPNIAELLRVVSMVVLARIMFRLKEPGHAALKILREVDVTSELVAHNAAFAALRRLAIEMRVMTEFEAENYSEVITWCRAHRDLNSAVLVSWEQKSIQRRNAERHKERAVYKLMTRFHSS